MIRTLSLLVCVAVGASISAPMAASAHASVASTNPGNGERVQTMPATVALTLSEPIRSPAFIAVVSKDGSRVNSKTVRVRDNTATSTVDKPTSAGAYSMNYRIVSADGHVVTGSIKFSVLQGDAPTPAATTTPPPTPQSPTPPATGDALAGPAIKQTSSGSTMTRDALVVVGFAVLAMAGLVFLIRAGLRSAGAEDD